MKKRVLITVLIIAVAGLVMAGKFLLGRETVVAAPSIQVTPASYDLGTVIYGDVATHTLRVANTGTAPLIIQRLSTSCGCTKAFIDDSQKTILPGGEAVINITFDPAVHKDDSDVGDIVRVVYIRSNDPLRPEVEAEFKAFVVK